MTSGFRVIERPGEPEALIEIGPCFRIVRVRDRPRQLAEIVEQGRFLPPLARQHPVEDRAHKHRAHCVGSASAFVAELAQLGRDGRNVVRP